MKHTDYVNEIEKDPQYRLGKEALKARFALGDAVLRARIERGWSQTELAARVGTKQANISRIEAGLANPTLDLIQKIIRVLELGIEFPPLFYSTAHPAFPYSPKSVIVHSWSRAIRDATNNQTKDEESQE